MPKQLVLFPKLSPSSKEIRDQVKYLLHGFQFRQRLRAERRELRNAAMREEARRERREGRDV